MTQTQIVAQLARKDEEALLHLRDRYEVYCLTIARRLLRDEQAAEECVSDVWLAVWRSEAVPTDLRAYLARVTRNIALHYLEREGAQKRSGVTVLLDELAECIPDPLRERETDAVFLREVLNDFVRGLKPEARELFVKRYWYGYSVGELAALRGWQENRVSALLSRLRKKLRKRLEKEGYTP